MKEDKFEKYIREFRNDLDVEDPDMDLIWQGVQQNLPKRRPVRTLLSIAASIAILLSIGVYYFTTIGIEAPPEEVNIGVAQLDPSLAEEEKEFQQLISDKEKQLDMDDLKQSDFEEIFHELALLEKINKETKADISEYGKKDQLIKTLMKYYEQKIRLLELLSNEIEKKEYNEVRNKEKRI